MLYFHCILSSDYSAAMGRSRSPLRRRYFSLSRRSQGRKYSVDGRRGEAYWKTEKELQERMTGLDKKIKDVYNEFWRKKAYLTDLKHLFAMCKDKNASLQVFVNEQVAMIGIYEKNEKLLEERFDNLSKESTCLSLRVKKLERNQSMTAKQLKLCIEKSFDLRNGSASEDAEMMSAPKGIADEKRAGGIAQADDEDEESNSEASKLSDSAKAAAKAIPEA